MAILLSLRGSVATAAIPWSKVRSICFSLFRWDSSLSFRMTCKKVRHIERSEISHDQSEEHIPPTFSVGFFTIVQNDVSKKVRHIKRSEISHDQSEKIYVAILFRWDSSLSLKMTYKKYVILSASEISHRITVRT